MSWWWSWVLTLVGLTCFVLAGRKVWWAWYVGLAGQSLWLAYSIGTEQWGFLLGVVAYTSVYSVNQARWTREHHADKAAYAGRHRPPAPLDPASPVETDEDPTEPLDEAIRNWAGPPIALHAHSVKTSCYPGCPAYARAE